MTDEELTAIRRRAHAATPGPWVKDETCPIVRGPEMILYDEGGHSDADAEFIAAARTDVPALLAEVDRLRTGLALAWADGFQSALDRPADAEEAIRYRDLQHFRQVRDIITGVTKE